MTSIEDLEKKLKDIKKQTSVQTDERIMEDVLSEFQRSSKIRQTVFYIGPAFKAVAALIVAAVIIGAVFLILRKDEEKPQIVKETPETKEQQFEVKSEPQPVPPKEIKAAEELQPKEEPYKLKNDLIQVKALVQSDDKDGLLEILDDMEMPAQMLAANYLGKFSEERIAEKLADLGQKHYPDEPNNIFDIIADKIFIELDNVEAIVESNDINKLKTTAPALTTEDSNKPQVVSITPPPGSEVAKMFELEIVFSRPVGPNKPIVNIGGSEDVFSKEAEAGAFSNYIEHIPNENKFVIPMRMPNNWYGDITLEGFVFADGKLADPVTINYRTNNTNCSEALLAKTNEHEKSETLISILQDVKAIYDTLGSVSLTVYDETVYNGDVITNRSNFQMQGEHQFLADVSEIMQVPFFVGSDGWQCWFYSGASEYLAERLITADYNDIHLKNVDICNPLGIRDSNLPQLLEKYNFIYEGTEQFDGQPCYLIRRYRTKDAGSWIGMDISTWWFDIETLLLLQAYHDYAGGNKIVTRYEYHIVNESIDESVFNYDSYTDIEPNVPQPLNEDYDTRFLNVIDGTATGRMSVRWGRKGPKGTISSGLN